MNKKMKKFLMSIMCVFAMMLMLTGTLFITPAMTAYAAGGTEVTQANVICQQYSYMDADYYSGGSFYDTPPVEITNITLADAQAFGAAVTCPTTYWVVVYAKDGDNIKWTSNGKTGEQTSTPRSASGRVLSAWCQLYNDDVFHFGGNYDPMKDMTFYFSKGLVTPAETLLTTITATGQEQASYSVENIATVSFSYTAQGSSAYFNNGKTNWGWWGYGWTATVNASEGYIITKCVFYDDKDRTATDSETPFVVETTEKDKTPQVNGTPILANESKGITKIEVYGYATLVKNDVTSISLNKNITTILIGNNETLIATVSPDDATYKTVVWSSDNTNVAEVDSNGKITAKSVGTANITARATNGTDDTSDDFTASCVVTVNAINVTGVNLNKNTTTILVGNNETLTATISPNNATYKTLIWSSNNTNVVEVNSNGKVTAKSAGTANITARATNGTDDTSDDITATCVVTVHAHSYKVSVNGSTATVKCSNDCPNYKEYTVSLNATDKDYDGTTNVATITKSNDLPNTILVGTINYVGRDGTTYNSTTAPTNVGKYTASVAVGDKTITKNFEIKALAPVSFISSVTYNPSRNTVTIVVTTIRQYIILTSTTTIWQNNYYIAKNDVTINGPVYYGANVSLILFDDVTLLIRGGLKRFGSELTIYGQEGQDGLLQIEGSDNDYVIDGDNITVNGGQINLVTGTNGTLFSNDSSITFNSALNLTATNSQGDELVLESGKTYTGSELNSYNSFETTTKLATLTDVSVYQTGTLTYNGEPQTAEVSASATAQNEKQVVFTYSATENGTYSTEIPAFTNAGNHIVYYKANAENHEEATGNFEVTIGSATLTNVSVSQNGTLTYNGEAQTAQVIANATAVYNQAVTFTYSTEANGTYGNMPAFTDAKTYTVYYKVTAPNHNESSGNFEVTIGSATLTNVSVNQNGTLTYNGEAQVAEVEANATAVNNQEVTFTYSTEANGTYGNMPAFTDAGTYTVYYKANATNHNEASGNFEVVIGKKSLTITAEDKEVTYGDLAPEYTVSYNGFVAEENATVLGGTLALACEYKQFDGVETYAITPSGLTSNNYEITFVDGTLTVAKKAITVTIANKTSIYGEARAELTATNNGIVNNDKVYTLACEVTATSNVGKYNIVGTAVNANYNVTFENQEDAYSVTPATLTNVSIAQNGTLTYTGEAQVAEVEANATAVNNQEVTFTYSLDGETYGEMPAFTNADTYTVYYKVTAPNHNEATGNFEVVIGKKALTVTADNKKVTYGDLAPEFTVKYNGFVVGETYTVLGGELKFACEYKQFDSVGTYKITPSGLESDNYEITFENGKLTVAQKAITVTIVNKTSVYGKAHVELDVTTEEGAIVNGDEVYKLSCEVTSTSKVGKYNITGKAINDNYNVSFENQTNAYEVTPATLTNVSVEQTGTLTYNGKTQTASVSKTAKAVNNQNVTFAYTTNENDDYTSSVPALKDAGTYTVYYKVTAPNHNDYFGSFEVTIGKKGLTVTANNKKTTYGSEAPEFTVKYNGFAKGETSEVLGGTLEFACEYKQFDDIGTYEITPSGLTSNNYEITFVDGTLTVNPKAITVTIVKKTSIYGEEPAELEATTVEGAIVNGDTNVYELSCEVTSASVVGKYNITGTALDANYNIRFAYEKDAYTVKKRAITLTVKDETIKAEEELPELTFTLSEEVSSEVLEELKGKVVLSTNADATKAGKYVVKAKFAENYYSSNVLENYTVTLESGELTVLAKVLKDETAVADVEVTFDNNEDAFPYGVKVDIEVITVAYDENSELDYSAISAKYVDKKSEITKVYSIKLLKTVIENGEEKLVEVQPNEVKEGTTIVIKMEIPEELIGKNFRVLHIHSAEDVEYVDEANVEVKDGFAYVKVNRLSEFAFVTKKATHGFCSGWIFFIIDCVLVACFVVYVLLKRNKVLGLIGLIAILAAIVFGTIVLILDGCLIAVISMYLAMLVFGLFLTGVLLGQKKA